MSDFEKWARQTFHRSTHHLFTEGHPVTIQPIAHRMTMTAEQAAWLAAFIAFLASEKPLEDVT